MLLVWRPRLFHLFFLPFEAWATHCAFPSSWGVKEECTAGCSVEPDGPGALFSWNLQHGGLGFTPVTAVTHYRRIRQSSLKGEHGSVTIQLHRKAWFSSLSPCSMEQALFCLPQSAATLTKEESPTWHSSLPSPLPCLGTWDFFGGDGGWSSFKRFLGL